MEQNGTEKPLTAKQAKAAALLAADELSDEEIADKVGVGRTTLARWKQLPDFANLINEHVAAVEIAMLRLDIAKRHKRVAILNDMQDKMLAIMDARSVAYADVSEAHGGATGLIVHDVKAVGSGRDMQLIDVYGADLGLMKELRATQEQAAKELGQWIEKSESTGKTTSKIELVGIDAGDI